MELILSLLFAGVFWPWVIRFNRRLEGFEQMDGLRPDREDVAALDASLPKMWEDR